MYSVCVKNLFYFLSTIMPRDEVTRLLLSIQKDIKSLKDRVESLECSMDSKMGKLNKLALDDAHSIGVDLYL